MESSFYNYNIPYQGKHIIFLVKTQFLFVLSILLLLSANVFAQKDVIITYSDYYNSASKSDATNIPIQSKLQRVNSKATTIISTNTDLSEDVQKALDYAISVWRVSILNCDTIYLSVTMDEIEEDIRTNVTYSIVNQAFIPNALKAYLNKEQLRDSSSPDGSIIINKNIDWDYSLKENRYIQSNERLQ